MILFRKYRSNLLEKIMIVILIYVPDISLRIVPLDVVNNHID